MSLWVDKYRPTSLSKLDYHKDLATHLKKLVRELFTNISCDLLHMMDRVILRLERFSLDCRKTKTKVNTLANQRA